mmetsp:Transcript_17933/g.37505  ORF Transcript_17933/g.37505 Transcript_17933/m.37505 type:complete len:229 (+) Transcript_17933:206-892(+)
MGRTRSIGMYRESTRASNKCQWPVLDASAHSIRALRHCVLRLDSAGTAAQLWTAVGTWRTRRRRTLSSKLSRSSKSNLAQPLRPFARPLLCQCAGAPSARAPPSYISLRPRAPNMRPTHVHASDSRELLDDADVGAGLGCGEEVGRELVAHPLVEEEARIVHPIIAERVADLSHDLEQRLEDDGREEDDESRHGELRDLRSGRHVLEHERNRNALLEREQEELPFDEA